MVQGKAQGEELYPEACLQQMEERGPRWGTVSRRRLAPPSRQAKVQMRWPRREVGRAARSSRTSKRLPLLQGRPAPWTPPSRNCPSGSSKPTASAFIYRVELKRRLHLMKAQVPRKETSRAPSFIASSKRSECPMSTCAYVGWQQCTRAC